MIDDGCGRVQSWGWTNVDCIRRDDSPYASSAFKRKTGNQIKLPTTRAQTLHAVDCVAVQYRVPLWGEVDAIAGSGTRTSRTPTWT